MFFGLGEDPKTIRNGLEAKKLYKEECGKVSVIIIFYADGDDLCLGFRGINYYLGWR